MATRQNSLNGNPKSPRIQVVLPEDLCNELSALAKKESRTVSNMAKVLIQQGIERFTTEDINSHSGNTSAINTEKFRSALETQEPRRLRGAPKRIRFQRP
tara:strand:+ start:796 stop:1095 length:300 start_codon:yes stop_codon:yes gene_type:complete